MPKHVQVALAFALSHQHLVRMLRGIEQFARERGNWAFTFNPEEFGGSIAGLQRWPGDGIISTVITRREARIAHETGLPVVNLSGALRDAGLPRVMVDHEAVGRLAAEHLLERGFQRFGYFGVRGVWFAQQRKHGFVGRLKQAGVTCSVLETPSGPRALRSARDWLEPLDRWLGELEPPVGVMASTDLRATMVIDACVRVGLRVPDDVAVVGVDNNEVTCELCSTPLSSVSRSDMQVGYEAASLLDRLMSGKRPISTEILIPPDRVVQRRSTDILAVGDPEIATVLRYIREHISEPFGLERLLRVAGHSRRWLTRHFEESLGRTPHEFLCLMRVEEAKRLLTAETKLSLHDIAHRCGFSETRNLRQVFNRVTGVTPFDFRRSYRQGR